MKTKSIAYWTTTILIAFFIGSGGILQVAHVKTSVDGFVHILGYPAYFVTILGVWKILGPIAILVPRFPRLKEWAYAGIFFDLTGAAASTAAVGGYGAYGFHVIVPLILAGLLVASWALRPESRKIGVLFPAKEAQASVNTRVAHS
ncbi:MAG: DoxX family protein [Terracidiphilus sp.]